MSVAERLRVTAVDFVYAAPMLILREPLGFVESLVLVEETVIVSVAVLPAPSVAFTVMTLLPLDNAMLEIDQAVVPLAVPLPPLSLLHVILLTPLVLSEAVPPRLIVLLVVEYVEFDVGLVMVIAGAVVSRVMESLAVADTFPAASLYHT